MSAGDSRNPLASSDRHGGVRLGFALACLLSITGAAAAETGEPGFPIDITVGDRYEWMLVPGAYWIQISAGPEGFAFDGDLTPATSCATPPVREEEATPVVPSCPGQWPGHVSGTTGHRIELNQSKTIKMTGLNGTARVLVADPTLMQAPVQDHDGVGRAIARGTLHSGCVAHHITTSIFNFDTTNGSWLLGPIRIVAAAPGATLRFLDGDVKMLAESPDIIEHEMDDTREHWGYVQICATDATPYVIHVERQPQIQENRAMIPAAPEVLLLGLACAAILARRPR